MEPTSSGFIDTLSNLNVGWILAIVAVLTLIRYNMLKTDGDSMQTIAEYVESGIVAVVLVWMIIRPFAVQAYFIPSPSMEPTLFGENGSGDKILVNKFNYRFTQPQRDDVVVFIPPVDAGGLGVRDDDGVPVDENDMPVNFIKRLIGRPGDTLEAHAGVIFVNGKPYDHKDIRDLFAAKGVFGPNPPDEDNMQAEHHVKFLAGGVQVDGSPNLILPAQIATYLNATSPAIVKITPGYTMRNGKVLDEPFTAEDPDYDLKIYNGQPLKDIDPYQEGSEEQQYKLDGDIIDKGTYEQDFLQPTGKIPTHHYFMMGDNRNDSEDSTEWGPLESNRVIGRAQFIFWPINRAGIIH